MPCQILRKSMRGWRKCLSRHWVWMEASIIPSATLQGDLGGAESIDFLDIVFRIEKEFGIKIPRGELFPESIFQGNPDLCRTAS